MAELVPTVPVAKLPALLLLALGERLRNVGGDATPFLKQVQQEYPADFWANLIVGYSVLLNAPAEASGYYRAALSSRPEAGGGLDTCAVGDALRLQKQPGEATRYYEKALVLDPGYARAHSNLGLVLQAQDRLPDAIDCYQKAPQFDPELCLGPPQPGTCAASCRPTGRGLRTIPACAPTRPGQRGGAGRASKRLTSVGTVAGSARRLAENARCRSTQT